MFEWLNTIINLVGAFCFIFIIWTFIVAYKKKSQDLDKVTEALTKYLRKK